MYMYNWCFAAYTNRTEQNFNSIQWMVVSFSLVDTSLVFSFSQWTTMTVILIFCFVLSFLFGSSSLLAPSPIYIHASNAMVHWWNNVHHSSCCLESTNKIYFAIASHWWFINDWQLQNRWYQVMLETDNWQRLAILLMTRRNIITPCFMTMSKSNAMVIQNLAPPPTLSFTV